MGKLVSLCGNEIVLVKRNENLQHNHDCGHHSFVCNAVSPAKQRLLCYPGFLIRGKTSEIAISLFLISCPPRTGLFFATGAP